MKNSTETLEKRRLKRAEIKAAANFDTIPKTILRVCKDCGLEKPCHFMSSFSIKGVPEYRARCADCHRTYANRTIKANRTRVTYLALERKRAKKLKCVKYLGAVCTRCGYSYVGYLSTFAFHHVDPTTKKFEISQKLDRSWATLRDELDKCVLLCVRCHQEEHEELDRETQNARENKRQAL